MHNTEQLYQIHQEAVKYIDKIGAPQHHFRDGSVGKLSNLKISTEINHQRSPSATNYWTNADFDLVLSEVIKQHFSVLAQAALDLLKKKADESLIAEKVKLQERLAKIEELEQKGD